MKIKSTHQTAFTSVHVFKDKYDTFKQLSVPNGMTLQKLVNRSVYLYNTDLAFKEQIDRMFDLQISGSAF